MDELQRRFMAAAKHHGITASDIGDRLFVSSEVGLALALTQSVKMGAPVRIHDWRKITPVTPPAPVPTCGRMGGGRRPAPPMKVPKSRMMMSDGK
jgi:hypothetical protein